MLKKSSFIKLALLHSVVWLLPGCAAKEDQDKPKDAGPQGASGGGRSRSMFIVPIVTRFGPPRVIAPVPSAGAHASGAVRTGAVMRGGFGHSRVGASGSS